MKINKFHTRDVSFCEGINCEKRVRCKRWIEHYPEFQQEGYLSFLLVKDTENCNLFIDNIRRK